MKNKLHVAVVTYNRLSSTICCLESLRKTRTPYRLTVVDNGSRKDTRDYLQYLHTRRRIDDLFLFDRNMGVSCGYNFALSLSQSPFFVRLDNDVVVEDATWADVLIEVLTRRPDVGTVGFQFSNRPGGKAEGVRFTFTQDSFTGGACCMSRRDVHEKIGFWCEDYGIYGEEDSDFGTRLGLAGYVAGHIDQGYQYMRHEHAPYDADDGEIRPTKPRLNELNLFFLNKYMYENGLRSLFMPRKYNPVLSGNQVSFQVNEDYVRLFEEVRMLQDKLNPALQYTLHEYLQERSLQKVQNLEP